MQKAIANSQAYADSLRVKEDMDRMAERSANYWAQYQREQKAKQKRQAIIYMAMGVAFLVVLIIGMRRRMKKTK